MSAANLAKLHGNSSRIRCSLKQTTRPPSQESPCLFESTFKPETSVVRLMGSLRDAKADRFRRCRWRRLPGCLPARSHEGRHTRHYPEWPGFSRFLALSDQLWALDDNTLCQTSPSTIPRHCRADHKGRDRWGAFHRRDECGILGGQALSGFSSPPSGRRRNHSHSNLRSTTIVSHPAILVARLLEGPQC